MTSRVAPHKPFFPAREGDDQSTYAHRQLIGALGMVLPVLLWLVHGWRPTEGLEAWKPLSSVSAYYYTGAVAAFVGILIALAIFLFAYRGYGNDYQRSDRLAAIIAGAAAVVVAFFPTDAPGTLPEPSWWTPRTGTIHYVGAVVLFGSFSFFSLFLFPKSKAGKGQPLPRGKRTRNGIYHICGAAMLACILWAGIALSRKLPIFWPEALALEFFAVSWLAKGRADRTAAAAAYYCSHPRQLLGKVKSAVQPAR
jgi:hypothetical protein